MLVSDDSGGLNVYLPNPKLLITQDTDDKKKKKDDDDKDKLDLSLKVLNIPGVTLEKKERERLMMKIYQVLDLIIEILK